MKMKTSITQALFPKDIEIAEVVNDKYFGIEWLNIDDDYTETKVFNDGVWKFYYHKNITIYFSKTTKKVSAIVRYMQVGEKYVFNRIYINKSKN
jgi:hypothetical protein